LRRARPLERLTTEGYRLEIEDGFIGPDLDRRLWLPHYLPHWSSRARSAARFEIADSALQLRIDADQPAWCPEFDGWLRVSSVQTGAFAGPLGSGLGQHRFRPDLVVREERENLALYTPRYGLFAVSARALADPRNMVALWMIGYEDAATRSAEICVFEIFGRDVHPDHALVGLGLHPFGDPTISDEFGRERVAIDARDFHEYAAEWTPDHVAFYVDHSLVKVVHQSPAYPMQLMLGIYEFADGPELGPVEEYPKRFVVDWFRAYRPETARSQPAS
jgi:hypothetical protein